MRNRVLAGMAGCPPVMQSLMNFQLDHDVCHASYPIVILVQ